MEDQLKDFLANLFQAPKLNEVMEKLEAEGLQTLQDLKEAESIELQQYGLTQFQINKITKAIKSQQPNAVQSEQTPANSQVQSVQINPPSPPKDLIQTDKSVWDYVNSDKKGIVEPEGEDEELNEANLETNSIHTLPASKIISNKIDRMDQKVDENASQLEASFLAMSSRPSAMIPLKAPYSVLTIFETYVDCGAEYKMDKIKLNEPEYRELMKLLKHKKVQVIGFLGFYPSILKQVQLFLGIASLEIKNELNEGIILIIKEEKIALVYKTDHQIYEFEKPAKSTNMATTYTRYLIDLCEQILVVPHPAFRLNPDMSSPFNEKMNPGFSLEQKIIKPDEKVTIKQIPVSDSSSRLLPSNYLFSIDYSKYIQSTNITFKKDKVDIKHEFKVSDLQKVDIHHSMSIKKYSYREIQDILLDKWILNQKFFSDQLEPRKFEKTIVPIVEKFISKDCKYDLQKYVAQLQDNYLLKYQENKTQFEDKLKSQKVPLYYEFVKGLLNHNCNQFNKEPDPVEGDVKVEEEKTLSENQPQSFKFWNKVVSIFQSNEQKQKQNTKMNTCSRECSSWGSIYTQYKDNPILKHIDWEILNKVVLEKFNCENPWIHKTLKSDQLFRMIRHLSTLCEDINNKIVTNKKSVLQALRTQTFLDIFKFCESKLAQIKQIEQSLTIKFSQINIIRNKEHQITNWTLTKLPQIIYHQFQKVFSDHPIVVKDIFQIFDQSGLILIQNYPLNKSSVYQYNISKKDSSMFTHIINLSTQNTNLRIEPFRKQWFSFDNTEKRFNLGRLSKDGRMEDGAPVYIYDQRVENCTIESIRDATFQPNEDTIILIDQEFKLYQYRYQAKEFKLIVKRVNKGGDRVIKTPIVPDKEGDSYEQVSTTSDGKKIILKSKFFIDIYDLSWDKVFSIKLTDKFQYFKTFTDKIHEFLIIFERDSEKCYQIVGLSQSLALEQELLKNDDDESDKILGNPLFDYIYLCFKKFGPHSNFIGCPYSTKIKILSDSGTLNKMNVERYFYQLKLQQVAIEFLNNADISRDSLVKPDQSILSKRALLMILAGRLSIHVATIENFTLLPLQNGMNMNEQISEILVEHSGNSDLISKLLKIIKFGIFDSFIRSIKTQVHVISIVGRQSSGKSYVLNRFFGTRLDVAATRCTDGIWMSCVEMYDDNGETKVYVILDCEGLFSARRNEQEEMKLCLALSAVSDIMILNQDLSFNRYLNSLFNSFTKSIGRIKGKKLFKGLLMVLIRDIKDEAPAAYQELRANISQIQERRMDSFLTQVFNGKLLSQCLNYFEQPKFNEEIDMCRKKYFFSLNTLRWANGNDFIESFKITLAQIYLDDDTDMDIHKLKIVCNTLYNEALNMFSKGGENFKSNDSYKKEFKISKKTYKVQMAHSELILIEDKDQEEEKHRAETEDKVLPMDILVKYIVQTLPYSQPIHNEWMKAYTTFVNELLDQRQNIVLNYFSKSVPDQNGEFEDIIKSYQMQLKSVTDNYILEVKRCSKTCKKCERICGLNIGHEKDCDCKTSHICEQVCKVTKNCQNNNYLCVQIFGHEGDHRCGEGNHKCSNRCGIKGCLHLCSLQTGHGKEQDHNCGNKHPCKQTCFNEKCKRSCQYDMVNEHKIHDCGEVQCTSQCDQCKRTCIFPHHFHDQYIRERKNDMLKFRDEKGKEIIMDYHNCGNNHECQDQCTQNGVCKIDYKAINKVWKNKFGEFEYIYFQPLSGTSQCKIQIPKFLNKHENAHNCKIGKHRCKEQCPECRSICNKEIGHDGCHDTKNHRNKEHNVFVSLKNVSKLEVEIEGNKRAFAPGESTAPENCTSSCQRKGRAHYHIKECKGPLQCEAKMNPRVQHATEKFYPFEDKIYDKWLCKNYWNSLNWEPPCDHETKKRNEQCNFYCGHSSHVDDQNFCMKEAWHEDAHAFDCVHDDTSFQNIDIVFCCDTTGSMYSYIENSKIAVTHIIKSVKETIKGTTSNVQFGFVAYRDHHESDEYVTKMQNLTNDDQVKAFIGTLSAGGGGDGPEAVLDGLNDAIFKIRWRKKSQKYLFHIADAPPHGRQYTNGGGDSFPDGCPCGITIEKLADKLAELSIKYKLLKIGDYPNEMASIFKSKITNYEEDELDEAPQLVIKATEIIVRDIKCNELDVKV